MSNEPSWDDIFRSQPGAGAPQQPAPQAASAPPMTRREAREAEERGASTQTKRKSAYDSNGNEPPKPRKKRRLGWLWALIAVLVIGAAGTTAVWVLFEDQVRKVMGWELPIDYTGSGNGTKVNVVIKSGDIGSDIARTLEAAGVVMTNDAFYQLLLGLDPAPSFLPGTYALQEEMSAKSALEALQDPANRVVSRVVIREGITLPTVLKLLAEGTGLPIADFEEASKDLASFGVGAEAPSLEGYLFPATYSFDPGLSAHDILQTLVTQTFTTLDAHGVEKADRHRVLTIASLTQREARLDDDFYKVSRVVQNRLAAGMKLEFDSTAHYGAQSKGSVWTSAEERADDNPYNTYFHKGLPIGPIGAAGETAIDAAINPADGNWIFFVAVNLKTGETVFTSNLSDHNKAVQKLRDWCKTDEAADYCD